MANLECQNLLRSLPPGIDGNICGYLTVEVRDVSFHRKNVRNVQIYISWWGEKDYVCMRSSATNITHRIRVTTRYIIRTSDSQFLKYLKVCESVRIKVVDQEDSKTIGFLTLHDLWLILSYYPYKSYFPIFDGQYQTIGELHIKFHVVFLGNKPGSLENLQSTRTTTFPNMKLPVINSAVHSQDPRKLISPSENKKYYLKSPRSRFLPATFDPGKCSLRNALDKDSVRDDVFRSISVDSMVKSVYDVEEGADSEENVMDYILGKRMNETEEKKAINCLKDWPALESVLEVLGSSSKFIKKSSSNKKEETTECRQKFMKNKSHGCDEIHRLSLMGFQIYLKIISIEFNSVEDNRMYKSTFHFPNSGETYFIEYRFPSSNPKESEIRPWKEPPRGVRMSSKKQVGSVVFFSQSSIHYLSKKHQELDEQLDTTLVFRILSRNLHQRVPSLIGEAQIPLRDLLPLDEHAGDLRKLRIFTSNTHNHNTKGMLVLRIKWVQMAKGLENNPEDESDVKTEVSDANDGTPTLLQHINTPVPDSCMSPEVIAPFEREVPLLHILLNVSEAYYCLTSMESSNICKRTNFNIYLVFRAFWNKEIPSRTHIVWSTNNPKFEFSVMVPLKITPNFISMCQENYMVVELWHKPSEMGKDDLLGIAKVPLHQFYASYKDPAIFAEVIKLKHPVVSMNGNVKVYNPMDPSKICGWINVLLALGSQDQLHSVTQSSFIRNDSNKKVKENTGTPLYVRPIADSSGTLSENQFMKLNTPPIEKYLQIHKITEFRLSSKFLYQTNYDCYIEYRLPNDQHVLKTSLKSFSSEIEFSSSPIIVKFLGNMMEEINFHVWCRCYNTNTLPQDRMVATAKLSLKRLFLPDNECCNKTWLQTFSLPLLSVDPNDYMICPSLGFLVIKFYDKAQSVVESCETESVKSNSRREIIALPKKGPEKQNQESQTDIPLSNSLEQEAPSNHVRKKMIKRRKEKYSKEIESITDYKAQENNERFVDMFTQKTNQDTSTASVREIRLSNTSAIPITAKNDSSSNPNSIMVGSSTFTNITSNKTKSIAIDLFKVHIEIEKASHLKCDALISGAYVTFWSYNKIQLWISSNLQPGDHPKWNWHCDTHLNGDLLIKNSEKLILEIWTTKSSNTEPNPSGDIKIGSAAIDLKTLIYGMPQVSGWFNILNSRNQCCGQIKITVTPVEDLSKFKQIAVKRWLADCWKNDKQLIPPDLSAGRIDLYMEEDVTRNMEIDGGLSREEIKSNLSENEVKSTLLCGPTNFDLRSKIAELDEAMKLWRENLTVREVDDYSNSALAETHDIKIPDTHPDSPISSQGSLISMSSNISQNLSRVNPSTELKILEKYVSELVQNIQNNGSPSCISPMLEELFHHYEYGGLAMPDKEVIEKGSGNIQGSDQSKPTHSGKEDFYVLGSSDEMAPKDMTESLMFMNEALFGTHICKSNNDITELNEYSSDFHSESEDGSKELKVEKQGTYQANKVGNFQDFTSIQTEVIDLPRQAPEGGNPVEDEMILANRVSSQIILNSSANMRNQDENIADDDGAFPVLDALDVNQELERIEKIFNTTFTKE